MPRCSRLVLFSICTAFMGCAFSSVVSAHSLSVDPNLYYSDGLQKWSPAHSISLPYFSGSSQQLSTIAPDITDIVNVGPDGRYFFVIQFYGDIERDEAVAEIKVWATADIVQALHSNTTLPPAPLRLLNLRSNTSTLPVAQVKFDETGSALTFLATDSAGVVNLNRIDIVSGMSEQLSHLSTDVIGYDYHHGTALLAARENFKIAPMAYPMESIVQSWESNSRMLQMRRQSADRTRRMNVEYYIAHRGFEAAPLGGGWSNSPSLSPDGRFAVGTLGNREEGYYNVIIDAQNGQKRRFADVESTSSPGEILSWSPNGKHLLLRRLAASANHEKILFESISIYSPDGETLQIAYEVPDDSDVRSKGWLTSDSFMLTEKKTVAGQSKDQPQRDIQFSLQGGHWLKTTTAIRKPKGLAHSILPGDLKITLRQSTNDPPVLLASSGRRSLRLLEPASVLKTVWRADSRSFSWSVADKKTITAGLYLPRDYVAGKRVPLVVQTYHYWPEIFLPDGHIRAGIADCAQSLVASGIAVLQMEGWEYDADGEPLTEQEGPHFVAKVDAAVSELDRQGIIDTARVALSGFSRAGYLAHFAITHPGQYRFAAVVINDSFTGSYIELLQKSFFNQADFGWSTGPFWQSKDAWLDMETTFNADRIRTPALFTYNLGGNRKFAIDPVDYETGMQIIANTFALNKKPFEMLFFPDAPHVIARPQQQLALHNAVLDWMRFWLKDEAPADTARHARWAKLKQSQEKVLKQPEPPRGHWIFVPESAAETQ